MLFTEPPSLQLPSVRDLKTLPAEILLDCLEYLEALYSPGIRGSRITHRYNPNSSTDWAFSSSPAKAHSIPNPIPISPASADDFERKFAMRWLTNLLRHVETFQESDNSNEDVDAEMDSIVSRAAALLANRGGPSSLGTITRTLAFPSEHGPIIITLRDIPLENGDIASVGAQTWGGACVLAEIITTQPHNHFLDPPSSSSSSRLRVLELGAGTGLVGLVFAKVAHSLNVDVTVISTDFYPSVLRNLALNISTAFPTDPPISAHFLDWESCVASSSTSKSSSSSANEHLPPPLDHPFDIILGADIVYEPEHASWVHACVSRFLRRDKQAAVFHLVVPRRRTHTFESNAVETIFRRQEGEGDAEALAILSTEIIVCDVDETNGIEEVEYAYYRIGWKRKSR